MERKEKKKVQIQDYNLDLTTWDEYEVLQTFTCSILATLNSLNVNQQKKPKRPASTGGNKNNQTRRP